MFRDSVEIRWFFSEPDSRFDRWAAAAGAVAEQRTDWYAPLAASCVGGPVTRCDSSVKIRGGSADAWESKFLVDEFPVRAFEWHGPQASGGGVDVSVEHWRKISVVPDVSDRWALAAQARRHWWPVKKDRRVVSYARVNHQWVAAVDSGAPGTIQAEWTSVALGTVRGSTFCLEATHGEEATPEQTAARVIELLNRLAQRYQLDVSGGRPLSFPRWLDSVRRDVGIDV